MCSSDLDSDSRACALWTLQNVLINALKLLHPYMPFITEEVYRTLLDGYSTESNKESIMISSWPLYRKELVFDKAEGDIEAIKEAVRGIRNIRSEMNVAPSKKTKIFVVSDDEEERRIFEEGELFFASLSHSSEITVKSDRSGISDDAVSVIIPKAVIYIPLEELVDMSAEKDRLMKELKRLEGELSRSKGMLSNEKFLSKAPKEKIREEEDKLQKYQQTYEQIVERLEHFKIGRAHV